MKKFLEDLKKELEANGVSEIEVNDIISDHKEMLDQAFEQGLREEDIESRFGCPKDIAKELSNDQENDEDQSNDVPLQQHMIFKPNNKSFDVKIDLIDDDVTIEPSKDENIHVISSTEVKDDKYEIKFSNQKLKVNFKSKIGGTFFKIRKQVSNEFKILLPLGIDINLVFIKMISGDLDYKKINSHSLKLSNISGDQEIKDIETNHTTLSTVSGEIEVSNLKTDNLIVSLVSGDMEMNHISVKDEMTLHTVSGDFGINDVTCDHLELHTVSGDIEGSEVYPKTVKLTSVSGDINIENENTTSIEIVKKSSVSGKINIKS